MVIEIVRPMLKEQDAALRAQVVRVLGNQKSNAAIVGPLLKDLLKEEGAPWAEALSALLTLGDRGGIDMAQGWVAKSSDPLLLGVSIRYLGELGGKQALPVLSKLVMHGPPNLSDATLKKAIEAVQSIGLREEDAKKPAEDILVEIFKRHTSQAIKDCACWELGPFQNDEALKSLEQKVQENIKANKQSGREKNPDLLIELAENRLRFEQWGKAFEALNKAQSEDDKGLRAQMIEPLCAVALCGDQKLEKAKKILLTMSMDDRVELLGRYPVLEKMAKDPKYRDLFATR
jgi:hypothetical protein